MQYTPAGTAIADAGAVRWPTVAPANSSCVNLTNPTMKSLSMPSQEPLSIVDVARVPALALRGAPAFPSAFSAISARQFHCEGTPTRPTVVFYWWLSLLPRSEEHTSELQSP